MNKKNKYVEEVTINGERYFKVNFHQKFMDLLNEETNKLKQEQYSEYMPLFNELDMIYKEVHFNKNLSKKQRNKYLDRVSEIAVTLPDDAYMCYMLQLDARFRDDVANNRFQW